MECGEPLSAVHLCHPGEMLSDRHANVYLKYALARAHVEGGETGRWVSAYERMQRHAGYTPRASRFLDLIDSIRVHGFDPAHAIPVDRNYDILDGTHRLAACLALRVFPSVRTFSSLSRQFDPERVAAALVGEPETVQFLADARRHVVAAFRPPHRGEVVATIWGVSLHLWNEILQFFGLGRVRRAFQRRCSLHEYGRIVSLSYAADGISDKSLLRKIWSLSKFEHAVGIISLDIPNTEMSTVKRQLREAIVPLTRAYHYDSVIHAIDDDAFRERFLTELQPCKPVGDESQEDDFAARIDRFFSATPSRNTVYRDGGTRAHVEECAVLQIENRFKLVIFDMDGVLVDSERISASAYRALLAEAGHMVSFDRAYELFAGISKADGEQVLQEKFGIVLSDEQRLAKQAWVRARRAELRPIPGMDALLRKISCRTCIASGSSLETIGRTLRTIGFDKHFPVENRFSASMVARGKPAPDLFLLCARAAHVEPEECMVVEDSLPGIAAAKSAGMHFLWFSGAVHSEKYADQVVHYAGVCHNPDADALERSLRDYCLPPSVGP